LAVTGSFAQSMNISSKTNIRFWLFVDNVLQNYYSVGSISIRNMPYGNHNVRIELDNQNRNCFGQQIAVDRDRVDYSVVHEKGLFGMQCEQMASRPECVMDFIMPNDSLYPYFEDYSYNGSCGVNNGYSSHGTICGSHGSYGVNSHSYILVSGKRV
jgi:hypothetical protein